MLSAAKSILSGKQNELAVLMERKQKLMQLGQHEVRHIQDSIRQEVGDADKIYLSLARQHAAKMRRVASAERPRSAGLGSELNEELLSIQQDNEEESILGLTSGVVSGRPVSAVPEGSIWGQYEKYVEEFGEDDYGVYDEEGTLGGESYFPPYAEKGCAGNLG